MKLPVRPTDRIIITNKITAPQTRLINGKRVPMLSYFDGGGGHSHIRVTDALAKKSAGQNLVGRKPEGFDRLVFTVFRIHVNEDDVAFGIDIIPDKRWRSKVIPDSQKDVETVDIKWDDTCFMFEVVKRPYNFRAERSQKLIDALDAKARSGDTELLTGEMLMSNQVTVESVGSNVASFRFMIEAGGMPAFDVEEAEG